MEKFFENMHCSAQYRFLAIYDFLLSYEGRHVICVGGTSIFGSSWVFWPALSDEPVFEKFPTILVIFRFSSNEHHYQFYDFETKSKNDVIGLCLFRQFSKEYVLTGV